MGRFIFCIGNKAKTPFYFGSTGRRIYTMEELCYYFYHHIEFLEEDLQPIPLIAWIGQELGMEESAARLQAMVESNADAGALVSAMFSCTDYYSKEEIAAWLDALHSHQLLPPAAKKKRLADVTLGFGNRKKAMVLYQELIEEREFALLNEDEQGAVYHNLGVLLAGEGKLRQAAEYFKLAFEKNQEKESLCQYLYACKLGGDEAAFAKALYQYRDEPDLAMRIKNQFYFVEENRECSPEYSAFLRLSDMKDRKDLEEEFWWLFDELLNRLKKAYRD